MAAPPLDVSKVGNINGIVGSLSSARFGKSAKGQMSGANSAIFSSRDSTHPVLSAQLVGKARSIFATYCSFCENPAASSPAVASAVRGGGGGGGGGLVSEGSIVMSGPIDLTTASPADQPVGLNAKGVQRFMADIGCIMSENEAKDIIFALSQSGVILHKNAEVERLTVDGAEARSIMMSVRSLNTENSEAAAANSRNLLLTFPLFLELLMSTQSDCSAEDEIRATWNRLDRDSDGALGISDVRETLAGLSYAAGGNDYCSDDLLVLSKMSDVELQTLLKEYDLDADGTVSYDDLRKAVETS